MWNIVAVFGDLAYSRFVFKPGKHFALIFDLGINGDIKVNVSLLSRINGLFGNAVGNYLLGGDFKTFGGSGDIVVFAAVKRYF